MRWLKASNFSSRAAIFAMHRYPDLSQSFSSLGVELPILRALKAIGYEDPSPIQRELIPIVLSGKDVLGQARTGTGKTASFGIPSLQLINPEGRLQVVILTPTRELAVQVVGEIRRLAKFLDVHCVPVYGGTRIKAQLHQLGKRPHLIVGTPGRVIDMLERGALEFDSVRLAVLDEVDRMLDIGFREDIKRILGKISHPHQTVFVSATLDEEIKRLAHRFMNQPVEVNVSQDAVTVDQVNQLYCVVEPWDKARLLKAILDVEQPQLSIVFCNTKHAARKLAKRLHAMGIEAREIHGDLVQQKRESIMERFRKHKIPVLVATDLASRGIDVHNVTHIINYDVPIDTQVYVHRIGRTARMGATGKAITFVTKEQGGLLTDIEVLINKQVELWKVPGFETTGAPSEDGGSLRGVPTGPQPVAASAPTAAPVQKQTPSVSARHGKFPVRRRRR